MLLTLAKKIFGTSNDRLVKTLGKDVEKINSLEQIYQQMSDEELRNQTPALKARLTQGESLDDILHDAFAVVREASKRTLGMRHFDVQLIGGMIIHKGMISEMKTGEGKTLVATLPIYLNALEGKGVHLITVNDYLVKRDAGWMGQIYEFLGMSVGCIVHDMTDEERQAAYQADITYATNNELGFDYLRDNMKYEKNAMVQRPFNFGIVDEVDSILIDEARTPLIISGPTEDNSELYKIVDKLIMQVQPADYEKDEKSRIVTLTDEGHNHIEELLRKQGLLDETSSIYDLGNMNLVHHINQALRAHTLFTRDADYMVVEGKVMIIDEFTGRVMEGRRFSEGLHQALEAKENVEIQNENQTLASITYQNYFRLYPKLAGMTGTAMTEAAEFADIYKLEVVEIPTNVEVIRKDEDDEVYRTEQEKFDAIIKLIEECNKEGQPVLVGTVTIEKSEKLSALLTKKKIIHNVLNAKFHEHEASIIAQAGRLGAVTIATNMAGRGTDIMLGGNPEMQIKELLKSKNTETLSDEEISRIRKEVDAEKQKVKELGGLLVIGTERHESRRIDNQLRGRSGRQGDPGRTKFFLSLEDDLMRIFGSDRISGMLAKLGLKDGEAIFHPWISKALEKAQSKVEERNYEIRKNLLKFDDVMNDQRKVIYEQRLSIIDAEDISDTVEDLRLEVNKEIIQAHIPTNSYLEQWDINGLQKEILYIYGIEDDIAELAKKDGITNEELLKHLDKVSVEHFQAKEEKYGPEIMRMAYKRFMLLSLDQLWKDHLLSLDLLRQGISLRAYGQKDPLSEYKKEAFFSFENMLYQLRKLVVMRLAHVEVNTQSDGYKKELEKNAPEGKMYENNEPDGEFDFRNVGRNDPCPCGSGKKFKQCHGKLA